MASVLPRHLSAYCLATNASLVLYAICIDDFISSMSVFLRPRGRPSEVPSKPSKAALVDMEFVAFFSLAQYAWQSRQKYQHNINEQVRIYLIQTQATSMNSPRPIHVTATSFTSVKPRRFSPRQLDVCCSVYCVCSVWVELHSTLELLQSFITRSPSTRGYLFPCFRSLLPNPHISRMWSIRHPASPRLDTFRYLLAQFEFDLF